MKLTDPGVTDLHWMSVRMTYGEAPVIEFHELEEDAQEEARLCLAHPRTSVYVAVVTKQGEHVVRGLLRAGSKHCEVCGVEYSKHPPGLHTGE